MTRDLRPGTSTPSGDVWGDGPAPGTVWTVPAGSGDVAGTVVGPGGGVALTRVEQARRLARAARVTELGCVAATRTPPGGLHWLAPQEWQLHIPGCPAIPPQPDGPDAVRVTVHVDRAAAVDAALRDTPAAGLPVGRRAGASAVWCPSCLADPGGTL